MAEHSRDVLHRTANEKGPSRDTAELMSTVLGLAAITSRYAQDIRALQAESEPPLAGTEFFDLNDISYRIVCSLQESFAHISKLGLLPGDADESTRELYVASLEEASKPVILTSRSVYELREYREAIRKERDAYDAANRHLELRSASQMPFDYGVPSAVAEVICAATQSVKDAVVARESAWEELLH
ncbi:MAG: hypothetical protein E6R04_08510 [Spirochaetes bacterium]|nr:MAG: hypothetical protein E6R04_08510 [Spirochaetota bacterium]